MRRTAWGVTILVTIMSSTVPWSLVGDGLDHAEATSAIVPTLPELARVADVVVVGTVVSTEARLDERQSIETVTMLEVEEVLKGAVIDREMVIREPGGTVGDETLFIAGTATFHTGEHVLVFLMRRDELSYAVLGLANGKFPLQPDETGSLIVRPLGIRLETVKQLLVEP